VSTNTDIVDAAPIRLDQLLLSLQHFNVLQKCSQDFFVDEFAQIFVVQIKTACDRPVIHPVVIIDWRNGIQGKPSHATRKVVGPCRISTGIDRNMRRCLEAYQLPAVDIAEKTSNALAQRMGRCISHDAADVNFVSGYLILRGCFGYSRIPDSFTVDVRLVSKIQEIISKKL